MKSGRLLCLAALAAMPFAAGCGSRGVQVAEDDPNHRGAVLFAERCSGCHTLDAAGAQGSSNKISDSERVDGPNFNTRPEEVDFVLYAIRNGGASGGIMPENIVVGEEAQQVAEFLAEYAGRDVGEARRGPDAEGGPE